VPKTFCLLKFAIKISHYFPFMHFYYNCSGWEQEMQPHHQALAYLNKSTVLLKYGPPLWSSGQSSWLQIRRPGFDSRHYQEKKKVVGLEWGPLSLVSITEELLDRKVAAPV
jgi:hypothetical protein